MPFVIFSRYFGDTVLRFFKIKQKQIYFNLTSFSLNILGLFYACQMVKTTISTQGPDSLKDLIKS